MSSNLQMAGSHGLNRCCSAGRRDAAVGAATAAAVLLLPAAPRCRRYLPAAALHLDQVHKQVGQALTQARHARWITSPASTKVDDTLLAQEGQHLESSCWGV